jgi:hypothetical protein
LICLALVLISSACRKTVEQNAQVTIELEKRPTSYRVGSETISLKLTDADGQPITQAKVSLEGNMSHAGMAPVFGQATETGQGTYRGSLEFSMAGDWIVTIRATLSGGQQVERQFELKGVH